MIEILKASAGSGKTYTLAHSYIKLIMDNPDEFAFRHILAVTFTNKATDEMKSRILKELHLIAINPTDARAPKAARVLKNILHDYSAFSISTIDRFFQQTLRAFAHEMGQYNNYQVELDKEMLSNEAVDTILDELDAENPDDRELIGFLVESMEDKAMEQKTPDIEKSLKAMALQLKSEHFSILMSNLGLKAEDVYSTDKLLELKKRCRSYISSFEKDVAGRSAAILKASADAGIIPSDYFRGWFAWFDKMTSREKGERYKELTAAFRSRAENPDEWFSKKNASLLPAAISAVGPAVADFISFWDRDFKLYNTAIQMLDNVYGLGVAARLFTIFGRIQNERNVICLDESNTLLRQIIDGSDTPFVYEKTGVWIDHYLLDEFQDTSVTQWSNFRPLLAESESRGNDNLIVGDVKQSIYRWRESDWSLLDSTVEAEFSGHTKCTPLRNNYRSDQQIIDFNNDFYAKASGMLDSIVGPPPFEGGRKIADIYADVAQEVGKTEHKGCGYVSARFCNDEQEQLEALFDIVSHLHDDCSVGYGDIAVLVRTNVAGTKVAQRLIDSDIPVITEASLNIKNSISVRRLVSLMAFVDNPEDKVNSRVASDLGIPSTLSPDDLAYHNLVGLCDKLYGMLQNNPRCASDCNSEVAYIVAFVDYLMDYARTEGNNLRDFLKLWEGVNPTISSTLDSSSVKILTIHKSKGLDFPYVILPFFEDLGLYYSKTRMWCHPDGLEGTALEDVGDKLFHVGLSSSSESTAFASSYVRERYNQSVDAVNMAYVATTRAAHGMFLLGAPNMKDNASISTFADILYTYCNKSDCSWGDLPTTQAPVDEVADQDDAPAPYSLAYPVCELGGRLITRPYAEEFFTTSDDDMSYRQKGIVLHDILSRIVVPSDLEGAVDAAVSEGLLPCSMKGQALNLLAYRIAAHPEFFPTSVEGCRVLNETTIIASDGSQHRPDRMILSDDGTSAVVVDYKFGVPKEEYSDQIEGYKTLLYEMGYSRISAFLWFVYKDKLV